MLLLSGAQKTSGSQHNRHNSSKTTGSGSVTIERRAGPKGGSSLTHGTIAIWVE